MNASSPAAAPNLLDEALGLGVGGRPPWRVAFISDCVETSGAFVLHHLLKRALSDDGAVVFLALAQPFSHYDRVLRRMGCNLSVQKNKNMLHFFDLLGIDFSGETRGKATESGLQDLYRRILIATETVKSVKNVACHSTVIIDDLSLLEIAAHGSKDNVLDFLQYCSVLVSESDISLVILNHEDIYSNDENSRFLSHIYYLSDILIKTEPLSTGIAADVHGQISVVNKGSFSDRGRSMAKIHNFHFKVKENGVEYFYPGSKF